MSNDDTEQLVDQFLETDEGKGIISAARQLLAKYIHQIIAGDAQARTSERERIAKAVESWTIDPMNMVSVSYGEVSHTDTANNYAAAIRNLDGDDDK